MDYESLDISEIQNEYERVSTEPGTFAGNDDYLKKFVRLPTSDGYTLMRFLPRKKGEKLYCATRVHTLNAATAAQPDKKATYHCPKVLVQTEKGPRWQGECIICKYYSDLWAKSESLRGKAQDELQNQARAIKPVERYYYNAIVRAEKDKDGNVLKNVGPKVYSCGKVVHSKIMRSIVGDDTAGEKPLGDVTHPLNGRDFRLVKKVVKGSGGKDYPNYDNSKFDDVSPLGSPEELTTWIENLWDLQALRTVKSPEELKHALRVSLGMVKEENHQNDDDLEEFRNAGLVPEKPTYSEPLREELASSTIKEESGDEILADDDFMKELADM